MTNYNLFYYPCASFTNAQLPLLKVAALWFDKLVLLDPVGESWDTVGADHVARGAVRLLKDAGILEIVTPATVLAKYERPIAEAIRRDMEDREFLDLCDTHSHASRKQRWTLSLAKVPQDVQTDQTMRHLFCWGTSRARSRGILVSTASGRAPTRPSAPSAYGLTDAHPHSARFGDTVTGTTQKRGAGPSLNVTSGAVDTLQFPTRSFCC